jgi:hypothetical protein
MSYRRQLRGGRIKRSGQACREYYPRHAQQHCLSAAERCHLNNLPTNAAAHTSCGVVTPDDWCAKSYSPSTLQCIAQRVC